MLRQQRPDPGSGYCLCLADFLLPLESGKTDKIGVFAVTVDSEMEHSGDGDPYRRMLAQTLSDRLAEATAEKLHEEVRRKYWGYAPEEHLSIAEMHQEKFQGIRPAVGYPSMPDVSINFLIDSLLRMDEIGIRLTQSGMMIPHASVSGLMLAHPKARYFNIGTTGSDQLADYARRRNMNINEIRRFIK